MSRNPFNPGSGVPPPYLAGRKAHIKTFDSMLSSVEDGHIENLVAHGLRGTGKTVLLEEFYRLCLKRNFLPIKRLQFSKKYCEPDEFGIAFKYDVKTAVETFSKLEWVKGKAEAVIAYIKPKRIGIPDVVYYEPGYTRGKNVPFEDYLKSYLLKNSQVFEHAGFNGVIFLLDEFHTVVDIPRIGHYVLSDFIAAMNDVQRDGCKYFCVLAGLPNLMLNIKKARSYSERMFKSLEVGNLAEDDAVSAIEEPLKGSGYRFTESLVNKVVEETGGYPYFIQFYGKEIISNINKPKIDLNDFERTRPVIVKQLDDGFFSPRFELASEQEQKVLCAMTRIKSRDMRFSQIKEISRIDRRDLSTHLRRLESKGLVYQHHKEVFRFCLPLLGNFLSRRCGTARLST